MLKNFDEYLNESLEYTDFFGKKVSHEEALQQRLRDNLSDIIATENKVSEKSFKQYDQIIENVKNVCENNKDIYLLANKFYNKNKRLEYCAEKIYDKYFKIPKEKVINEMLDQEDVKGKVERSKKLKSEIKEKILPLIVNGQTEYKNGRVFRLKFNIQKYGCSLGADKNGFFVHTHRARSKSYPEIDKIPQKDIKFIESTG